ncbi:MAG: replicative DNA helicase [Calditrichae bacterium]|nr:replicative DNA helicase [Calditrichota bacterium]MCB9057249.1 replicative DNA helicase [Calditrichia bacterium]
MENNSTDDQILRTPPQSIDVEQIVLGALLLDEEAVSIAIEAIDASYFYKPAHKIIFSTIMEMFDQKKEIDLVTLTEELKRKKKFDEIGGVFYLSEIANSTPSSANLRNYLGIVKQKALSRMLIKECTTIIDKAFDQKDDINEMLDYAESKIFEISERRMQKGFADIKNILHTTFERIDQLYHSSKTGVTGVASSYKKLDEMTAGFQSADFIVLAGRPSMGKTAFALNLARNAAIDHGLPVGIFSLEMSSEALVMRLLCTEAKVNQMAVRTGKLSKQEMERLTSHVGSLMNAPIFIDDSASLNVLELRAKARRLKAEANIQMLVIDYLQLMEGTKGENRQQEITHISRSIKGIAKELDIPVIALSQLSRATETRDKSKKPQLSDLRESGAIEQDADVVLFVYRPEYYNIQEFEDGTNTHNMCEIIIGKQRNGPVGDIRLTFLKEFGKFGDPDLYHGSSVMGPAEF